MLVTLVEQHYFHICLTNLVTRASYLHIGRAPSQYQKGKKPWERGCISDLTFNFFVIHVYTLVVKNADSTNI